jgi:hypothetical protein
MDVTDDGDQLRFARDFADAVRIAGDPSAG